tara:strand:+ start:107 stop:616 length:510 start_codon:yes stop_codon:yes gene_type:complete
MPTPDVIAPILLDDKAVAKLLSFSSSWVRQQRFKRRHGEDHAFDVEPIIIGTVPRYRRCDVLDWIERTANPSGAEAVLGPKQEDDNEIPPFDLTDARPAQRATPEPTTESKEANKPVPRHARPIPSFEGCLYIDADPRIDPTNCGAEVKPGSSFCEQHHALCWKAAESE